MFSEGITKRMKIGSLFSGYGGLDLAVAKVTGGQVVAKIETGRPQGSA